LRYDRIQRNTAGRLLFALTTGALIVSLVLGGATWRMSEYDRVAIYVCIPLLAIGAWQIKLRALDRSAKFLLGIAVSAVILPILQLIALPPRIWQNLPGRELVWRGFDAAEMKTIWMPLSLDPAATHAVTFASVPAIAILISVIQMSLRDRRRLVLTVAAFAVISAAVSILQARFSAEQILSLHRDKHIAVGFFANPNHLASLSYVAITFVLAIAFSWPGDSRFARLRAWLCAISLCIILLFSIRAAGSLAGTALAGFAIFLMLIKEVIVKNIENKNAIKKIAFCVITIILCAFIAFVFDAIYREGDILGDYRFIIYRFSWQAFLDHFPLGAGFGTFASVYQWYEPVSALGSDYANRAHNDWLELAIEGGAPALFLALAALIWLARAARECNTATRRSGSTQDTSLRFAAIAAIVLLLLHSLVEYPLRTIALQAVLALLAALLTDPPVDSEAKYNTVSG